LLHFISYFYTTTQIQTGMSVLHNTTIMKDLRITTIQTQLHWENPAANRAMFDKKLSPLAGKTDVVVLPEMFTTGFSMKAAELAEKMDGTTMDWLARHAGSLNAVITGSLIAEENGHYYNRLIWMRPDGTYETYDKRHLFTMAKEHHTYTAGTERLITEWQGWKICPLICYDLRFPVWARNTVDYDVLIYTANWPVKRSYAWRILLHARAIENQAYTIGGNHVGKDGNGFEYSGDTMIVEPAGADILYHKADVEEVHTESLSYAHLKEVRGKLPFLADRDEMNLIC